MPFKTRDMNMVRTWRSTRWIVVCGLWALCLAGCRSMGPASMAVAREAKDSQVGQSVKPGINNAYRQPDLDVETWVNRFESESREIFKHRRRIVDGLGIKPGMVLGDIGAGTGLFTPLFSEAVGPTGKVLAVDITPAFLELIRTRARERRLRNVQTVLCDEDSTRLSPESIDMAFVCDTYHHFEYPKATLASIHRALKPGGRLIVIDFDRVPGKSREWIIDHVRAGREVVTAEIGAAGFAVHEGQRDDSYLEENYILCFRKVE